MPRLHLDGPCIEWHPGAHRGRLVDGDHVSVVAAVVGPETADGGLERARAAAARAIAASEPGLLPLLAVEQVGRRLAYVYEDVPGVGAGYLVDAAEPDRLPLGAAAALVAELATILAPLLGQGLAHPGPEPGDVRLTSDGAVHVAGLVGPFPPGPAFREPHGAEGPEALVYRLGILLVALVGGALPAGASDRAAHEVMTRRALIRAMSRPGGLPERYQAWMTGLIAWEADMRPTLSTVADGLRALARETGGPTLAQWAAEHVPMIRARLGTAIAGPDGDGYGPWSAGGTLDEFPPTPLFDAHATMSGDVSVAPVEEDDPTVETDASGLPPRRAAPWDLASIPVGVGPPAEGVRTPPSLPAGFLGPRAPRASGGPGIALAVISAALIAIVVALAVYLF